MTIIIHYFANRAASYLFSKLELYASALFFAEHGPETTFNNIYDFQVFFMPNDNEIYDKEIELLPKNFVTSLADDTTGIDSWEFIL
jgi:hypothetical protein